MKRTCYKTRVCRPGTAPKTVLDSDGRVLAVPDDWCLLEPGDATLTRRVKSAGPTWTMQVRKGRRVFSRGVWAPKGMIERIRSELEAERATPEHARQLAAGRKRRQQVQQEYEQDFRNAVLQFLDFAPRHQDTARTIAEAVTTHATPVGSGTVARTKRIPVERRAEAAVIAWMRHQTTAYDHMTVARVKGERRDVRRKLAARSRDLLNRYRRGDAIAPESCPLQQALALDRRHTSKTAPDHLQKAADPLTRHAHTMRGLADGLDNFFCD